MSFFLVGVIYLFFMRVTYEDVRLTIFLSFSSTLEGEMLLDGEMAEWVVNLFIFYLSIYYSYYIRKSYLLLNNSIISFNPY